MGIMLHFKQPPRLLNIIQLLILFIFFVSTGLAQNNKLKIQSGTHLVVSSNDLVLSNTDLLCDGSLDAGSGTVIANGSNNTSFSGAGTILMQIFTLNTSSASTLTLNSFVQVSSALNFQNGIINLNGEDLQLITNGVLQGESETSHITGITGGQVYTSSSSVNNPNQLNLGNLGAMLTTSANLGSLTVHRAHIPAVSPTDITHHGIQRTYLIQPSNNTSLNATLRFYYFNEELNGNDPNTLMLWKSSDGVNWTQIGFDTRNTVSRYVEKTGLADLSYWTLADVANALPITLLTFKATCQDPFAVIQWQTGSESGTNYFEIEKSIDGTGWEAIGQISASNNPNGSSYTFKDANPKPNCFYRLKVVDMTGTYSYSPIFKGGCSDIAMPFTVYPNPAHAQAMVQISVRQSEMGHIQLFNMSGQQVFNSEWSLTPGLNQFIIPTENLTSGTYIVKLILDQNVLQTKLIKQ